MFTMVDLAGTERSKDSVPHDAPHSHSVYHSGVVLTGSPSNQMYHDAKLRKETAEINKSLSGPREGVEAVTRP